MSGFSRLKGRCRFVLLSAVLWRGLSFPVSAAAGPRAPEVVEALDGRLATIGRMAPSADVVSHLWAAYYPPSLPKAGEAVAGQILLRAIQRPDALPRIAVALDAMMPGGPGADVSHRLEKLVGRYRREPKTFGLVQQMTAPLDRGMARSPAHREVVLEDQRLHDALFDGRKRLSADDAEAFAAADGGERAFSGPAARIGAGSRNFGQDPGFGGVRPMGFIAEEQRASLEEELRKISATHAPRVLIESELEALHAGRAAYSYTLTSGDPGDAHNHNFRRAARMINRWVDEGKDLELEMLIALNRALCRGVPLDPLEGRCVGKIRVAREQAVHVCGVYSLASPKRVIAYLTDFWIWYRANESRLHPIHLAAASYQQLARIHPFDDANGRTTRLIMDFILQRNGYPPAVFKDDLESAEAIFSDTTAVLKKAASGVAAAERVLRGAR